MKISKRLKKCADFVLPNSIVADVGTDHALLPIYLIENNIANKVIASDIRKGPLESALGNIKRAGLENRIDVVLSDGIGHLNQNVDSLIVSGMGGKLIAEILNNKNLDKVNRLILQANMANNILRKQLQTSGYKILHEEIIVDKKTYYEIIVAERGNMNLTETELLFGPVNLMNKDKNFHKHYRNELEKYEKILFNIPVKEDNHKKISNLINIIKKEL